MDGLHVGASDLSTASSSSVTADLKRRLFMLALLCGTWIPLLFFTVVGSSGPSDGGVQTTRSILLFLGFAHVPATLLLYLDRAFLRLVRENRARYVYLPIALITGSGVVFTYGGPTVQAYSFLGFVAWQAYHYGRQNVGVYSFAARAHGWRPEKSERWALELATACAICGTFKVLGTSAAPSYLHGAFDLLHRVGYGAFMAVVIFSVYTVLKHRRGFPASKAAFFFTLLLFFFPLFLWSDMDHAFFSYAIAHGFQYLAFVGVVSVGMGMREGRRGVSGTMAVVAALMVSMGLVGAHATDLKDLEWIRSSGVVAGAIDFAAGTGVGVTIAHFVIDAGAWRLSRPSVRAYMTKRFGFLLKDAATGSRGLAASRVS